jgi:hypothetical protein
MMRWAHGGRRFEHYLWGISALFGTWSHMTRLHWAILSQLSREAADVQRTHRQDGNGRSLLKTN